MPSKITFFYHDNLAGFSESWIDNARGVIDYPVANIITYLNARMLISGVNTQWDYVRVNDTDVALKRRVKVFLAGDPLIEAANVSPTGIYREVRGGKREPSDFGGTRFLIRKNSADLFQARFFMGGGPDIQIDAGGIYQGTGLFPANFTAFAAALKGLGYGWNSYTTPIQGSTAALQNAVTGTDGICTITVAPIGANPAPFLPPILPGQHIVVRIANQVSPKNANGTFTVVVTGPLTCRTVKPLSINNFIAGNGTLSIKKTVAFKAVDTLTIVRIVKRGPGRPFGLYRGRQAVTPRG